MTLSCEDILFTKFANIYTSHRTSDFAINRNEINEGNEIDIESINNNEINKEKEIDENKKNKVANEGNEIDIESINNNEINKEKEIDENKPNLCLRHCACNIS
ncbi:hypothetical protein Glove_166g225 [Diversispora epigaea]|uniref:Uncharacterized protein n=1 Tax=Diversispora epigaea TaxID=1348612 RepID=A0A397ITK9_9GLOM|nr:hypothetical protein Glove_166g225 [Diversispora epigaea]